MTMKLYISPNYSEIDEYITISKSGFFFSAEFIEKNRFKLLTHSAAETIFPAFPEDAGGRCSGETMRAS